MSITIEQRRQHRLTTIENSLARRHRQEKRFRFAGLAAVVIGLTLVTILFISILMRGVPAFWQSTLYPEIYFDPEVIQLDEKPERASGESQAAFDERYTQWLIQAGMVNWQSLIDRAMEEALGVEVEPRQLREVFSNAPPAPFSTTSPTTTTSGDP